MMPDNVRSMYVDANFVNRCLKKLLDLNKPNAPAEISIKMVDSWLEYLETYTILELGTAFREVVRTNRFFPDVADIVKVMDKNRFGLADEKFVEFKTILKEYRGGSHYNSATGGYRNCDEILGRLIERLGGMFKISDSKELPHESGGVTRKQFGVLYHDVVEKYYAGYYRDKPAPMVGSHTALAVGSDPRLLLAAKDVVPKLTGALAHEERKKAEKRDPPLPVMERFQLLLKEEKTGEPESVLAGQGEKMNFKDRLYDLAKEKAPEEDILLRDLNSTEVTSLKHCQRVNPKLADHTIVRAEKGWFSKSGYDGPGFVRQFILGDDPLFDEPRHMIFITV